MTISARVLNGRYRLVDVLGTGGMAVVYRADDLTLGRTVAIKILRDHLTGDGEFLERFTREGRAAAGLSHPNIITVFDVGQDGGSHYIVMELVEGEDLKELIRRAGPLPAHRVVHLGVQLASALDYAHRRGLVHRDVKPQNVLVTSDDHLKIGDFGIAVAAGARSITQTGMVMGSAHYMPPEQALGRPSTAASDVYSLGVVLYEMATGRLPFTADSPLAIARLHIDEPLVPPQKVNPRVPRQLAEVIQRAMEKDPRARFQSAADVADALRGQKIQAAQHTAALPRAGAGVQTVARTQRLPSERRTRGEAPRQRIDVRQQRRPGRRFGIGSFLILALLLGIVGATIGWVIGRPPQITPPRPTPAPVVVGSPNPTALPPTAAPVASPAAVPTQPPATPTRATSPTPAPAPTQRPAPTATPVPRVQVPALVGRNENDARRLVEQARLDIELREDRNADQQQNGLVVGQNPPPGTQVQQGSKVTVTIGRPRATPEPKPKTKIEGGVQVPNVEGMDESQARRTLENAGFKVEVREESAPDRKGQVVDQRPGAGNTVQPGTTVTIFLGV